MFRLSLLPGLVLISLSGNAVAQDRSADQLLPATTIFYAEIPNPPQLISTIFDHPLRKKIEDLEPYRQATKTDGYAAFLTGRKFVELQLGMEWREALETLTAKGIFIGLDAQTQGVAVLINAKDADSLTCFEQNCWALYSWAKILIS